MTLTELKYLIAVAQEGHFGRAARRVFVSQPTLSIGIKKLEAELDVQIFERLSHKVVPTQVGEHIVEAAKNTLMSVDTIRAIAEEAKGKLTGEVKLGAIYTICPYLLPKIIPDLREHAPDLQVYIREDYTRQLMESLKTGELDVALISLPVEQSSLFEIKVISEEHFSVILPQDHPLTAKSCLHIEDLDGQRVFLLGSGNCFREQVIQACPNIVRADLPEKQVLQGGSLDTIRMMVAGGLGVSIFPAMALHDDADIAIRPFAAPAPKRQIALAWRKSFIQQPVIAMLEDSIKRCQGAHQSA